MNKARAFQIIHHYRRYLLLIVVDGLFFGLISPSSSTFVIIPAFLLVILSVYALCTLVVAYIGKMFAVKPTNQKRIVGMITASSALVVALQSIGQLTVRDVVTIVPLILVLYLYSSYTKSRRA